MTRSTILSFREALAQGCVTAHTTAHVDDGVDVSILPGVPTRPAILGPECRVEAGALISAGCSLGARGVVMRGAVVLPDTVIGDDTEIGNHCVIGPGVRLGAGNRVLAHSVIARQVEMVDNNVVGPFASIGTEPQHRAVPRSPGVIRIGSRNVLREFITVHLPTHELTSIGNDCFLMAYCHVSHDTRVADDVTMANSCQIGGHTVIGRHANLGLSCSIHQYITIGAGAMVAMGSIVIKDIPPFVTFIAGAAVKLNRVGLQRLGRSEAEIAALDRFYGACGPSRLVEMLAQSPAGWWEEDVRAYVHQSRREQCGLAAYRTFVQEQQSDPNQPPNHR